MSIIRFYSDPHFHHRSMAIKRGFTDEIEMNEYIVTEWEIKFEDNKIILV